MLGRQKSAATSAAAKKTTRRVSSVPKNKKVASKKKSPVRRVKASSEAPPAGRAHEVFGLFFLAGATILLLSLFSHVAYDPGGLNVSDPGRARNLMGRLGALASDLMLMGFGRAAYVWPALLMGVGIRLCMGKGLGLSRFTEWAGIALGVVTGSILADVFWWTGGMRPEDAGGFIGRYLGAPLQTWMSTAGTIILAGVLFLLALMLVTRVSLVALTGTFGRMIVRDARWLGAVFVGWWRARMAIREARLEVRDHQRAEEKKRLKEARERARKEHETKMRKLETEEGRLERKIRMITRQLERRGKRRLEERVRAEHENELTRLRLELVTNHRERGLDHGDDDWSWGEPSVDKPPASDTHGGKELPADRPEIFVVEEKTDESLKKERECADTILPEEPTFLRKPEGEALKKQLESAPAIATHERPELSDPIARIGARDLPAEGELSMGEVREEGEAVVLHKVPLRRPRTSEPVAAVAEATGGRTTEPPAEEGPMTVGQYVKKKRSIPAQSDGAGGPKIVESAAEKFDESEAAMLEEKKRGQSLDNYELPPLYLLDYKEHDAQTVDHDQLTRMAEELTEALEDYRIKGQVTEIQPGPVITMFEYKPSRGTKISKIASLQDDLAMRLAAQKVRVVAPIPGKAVVGVEIPNERRETVYLKEILGHRDFLENRSMLSMALGKDVFGRPTVADLKKMPHMLIAGSTGSGKSVSINAMILSLFYKARPDEVKLILIDPKRLEFAFYEDVPHLLMPVVTDPKKAAMTLNWVVEEMERRYELMKNSGVKSIDSFNKKVDRIAKGEEVYQPRKKAGGPAGKAAETPEELKEKMPLIVVIIDEFADLMMVAGKEVEYAVTRLAQLARAAGIHLITATQRPSTDVITGLIKNNFPSRLSFKVSSGIDSRTILDSKGAETLLGKGDLLFIPPGTSTLLRYHGPFVSEGEIHRVVDFIKKQAAPQYNEDALAIYEAQETAELEAEDYNDDKYDQAIAVVCDTKKASISYVQRRLGVGYNRAAKMIEQMERDGIVGPPVGPMNKRKVYGRSMTDEGIDPEDLDKGG